MAEKAPRPTFIRMAVSDRKNIVVGAGLGGLTLALSLIRAGFEVTVLEQASRLGEVGAGIQISANSVRVLYGLGVAEALYAVAFRPERGEMRHWQTGETPITRSLGNKSIERFGYPYYHLHRADFHAVLESAVRAAQPDAVRLDARVEHIEQDGEGIRAVLASGDILTGDVLIGCDGIHSRVRQSLFGPDTPRFTGCIAWRTTIPVERLPEGHVRPVASNWIGRGGHFVHYYLRRGALVNCVGVLEGQDGTADSWSSEGEKSDFLADFADWHKDLKVLIRASESCFRWGLFDRDPMSRWGRDRISLLGDACHPIFSFMAQGHVMSLEDTHTLTRCLQENGDPASALQRRTCAASAPRSSSVWAART